VIGACVEGMETSVELEGGGEDGVGVDEGGCEDDSCVEE
jgi:hypothetical protein